MSRLVQRRSLVVGVAGLSVLLLLAALVLPSHSDPMRFVTFSGREGSMMVAK